MKQAILLSVMLLLFSAAEISAQESRTALIRDLAGIVEVKAPQAAGWTPAYRGQALTGDTTISTGFKSTAVIAVGNSVLTVRPLTRLSITELSRIQDNEKIELKLQTGRVRADVKPLQGGRTDFTVRSSAATASVRGTIFEFDTLNLSVSEGTVEFSGASGVPVLVDSGEASFVDGFRIFSAPPETLVTELRPELPPGAENAIPATVSEPVAPQAGNSTELSVSIHF
jgi:ferric-dicitrate binding protein FerR (iron transport regulator)